MATARAAASIGAIGTLGGAALSAGAYGILEDLLDIGIGISDTFLGELGRKLGAGEDACRGDVDNRVDLYTARIHTHAQRTRSVVS